MTDTMKITIGAGDERFTVELPDGWTVVRKEQLYRLQAAATLLSDLDRSMSGRHRGDGEGQDPTGVSQGNPFLHPGDRIGTTMSGRPIVVPEQTGFTDLGNPSLWTAES